MFDYTLKEHIKIENEVEEHIHVIPDRQLQCVMGWGVGNMTQ